MGLLFVGDTLTWEQAKKHIGYVKEHGVAQFLKLWDRFKDREGDTLLWGDEVRAKPSSDFGWDAERVF